MIRRNQYLITDELLDKQQNNLSVRLMFTDIDSLMNKMKLNVFMNIFAHKKWLDSDKCSKDSEYYGRTYNLVIGKMKIDACGLPMKAFVGFIAKLYTYIKIHWNTLIIVYW